MKNTMKSAEPEKKISEKQTVIIHNFGETKNMRTLFILSVSLLMASGIYAQKEITAGSKAPVNSPVTVITASEFRVAQPLNTMFTQSHVDKMDIKEAREMPDRKHRIPQKFMFSIADGPQYGNDPSVIQSTMGARQPKGVITSWEGQNGGASPQDPTGAAGLTKYVQAVNATPFAVYDKTGSGTPVFTGSVGTITGSTLNSGDPIIMYDKFADRWFAAQLDLFVTFAVAVSATNDPAGSWYGYKFTMPGFAVPDYLKFSVWENGYYMTSNNGNGTVLCFERAAMLAGIPGARMISTSFTTPANAGFGFWLPLPGDADGVLPPSGQPCPLFSYTDDGWGSGAIDGINIWSMAVTWGTTPAANVTLDTVLPTAAFDASYESTWNDITQPGSQKLDGLGGICMYRAQWNSFIGTNRVVLNWAVKLNEAQRSIKWVELRQDQSSNAWSLYQEGIYAPDSANRWCGSIAMDCNGDIALCYAKASATIPVSLCFTGRLAADPPGTMSFAENTVFPGTGSIIGSNRFGDYAHTSVDPVDGSTFWHTGMYCDGGSKTAIYSFQLAPCASGIVDANEPVPQLSVYLSGNIIHVIAEELPSNNEHVVQLYDITGKLIAFNKITPVTRSFETAIDLPGLSSGVYMVRIGTPDFQRVAKVVVP
jgi:hypothetical protein